jgi:ABC-2 type transport system permease protein
MKQSNLSVQWISFTTILRKEVNRFLRIWGQTILPAVINQSLYFLIFGAFIGSQVGEIQGVSYMGFIIPGLIMMSIIRNSFNNVVSSFFGAKFQRQIEELLVSPTSSLVLICGYTSGGILRGLIVGSVVYLVSMVFESPTIEHPFIVLLFGILTATVFSLGGFINAVFAKNFDDISIFLNFVLTPLTYLGGVFYSISMLPEQFQTLSKFNPILYMVDGFRYGFYGIADLNIEMSIAVLATLVLLLGVICWILLEKGLGMRS